MIQGQEVFVDAEWDGNLFDKRRYTAFVFKFFSGIVYWQKDTKRQLDFEASKQSTRH